MSNILAKFRDAHYLQLTSQGNVYTLTNLQLANGTNKILAASLKREVYCFDFADNSTDLLIPATKEILFTYIPGVVEIISLDVFNKSRTENDFVVGITITKGGNENYLNIYSAWDPSPDFNLDAISQNCLNIELSFIPYQLYHTNLPIWSSQNLIKNDIVWLLSGSDEKIHMYREYGINHGYKEIDLKDSFPELSTPPSIVMWMDIKYIENNQKRISAYGCECGYVFFAIVNTKTLEIMKINGTSFDNSIATVKLFRNDSTANDLKYQLLVGNTTLSSVVFLDVLENGLSRAHILEGSDYFNITSCACVTDVNFDGMNEILLGKYGQQLLAYKFNGKDGWELEGVKSFANPIYGVLYVDVTGDGVKELVVLTLRGVQIMQHDPDDVQKKLEHKLKLLNISV